MSDYLQDTIDYWKRQANEAKDELAKVKNYWFSWQDAEKRALMAERNAEFWKAECWNQQELKEKAEGKIVTLLHEKEAMWNEVLGLRMQVDALLEERDHLLAANDEYQEKLRFEGDAI